MLQVALPSVEIMLVLPTIISSVVFLDYFSLFGKKFTLFLLMFIFLPVHKLATANITSPDSLDFNCSFFLILEFPFYAPQFNEWHDATTHYDIVSLTLFVTVLAYLKQ